MEHSDKRYFKKIEELTAQQKADILAIKPSIADGGFHVIVQDIPASIFNLFVRTDFVVDKMMTQNNIDKQLLKAGYKDIEEYMEDLSKNGEYEVVLDEETGEFKEVKNKNKKEMTIIDMSELIKDVYIVDYARLACAIATLR